MIFIIDDDIELGHSLQFLFKTEGLESLYFSEPSSFLEHLNVFFGNENPDIEMISTVCLLDLRLGQTNGLDLLENLKNNYKDLYFPVAMISGHGDIEIAVESMKMGAFDYVTKPIETEKLNALIDRGFSLSKTMIARIISDKEIQVTLSKLTQKETQIMKMIASGNSNKSISDQLGNSIRTVELHRSRIFQKLQVNNAAEIATLFERYQNVSQK